MIRIKKFHKKGIFFTFIAITIVAALLIFYTPIETFNIGTDAFFVKTRVETINGFVEDLENSYFDDILKISSKKGILALISFMEDEGFYADIQSRYSEVVLSGTINGQTITSMQGNTVNDWLSRMVNISKNSLNINTNFTVNRVEIYQIRPWFVELKLNVSFTLISETSSWNVTNYISNSELSIENFQDPYYFLNTNGNFLSTINRSNVTPSQWNLEKVKDHIRQTTYTHFPNSQAPNFLMRFTNTSINSSCCGIESLANPPNLNLPDQVESYSDFLLFNHSYQNKCSELFNITESSFKSEFPHFKIDFDHLILYNISISDTRQSC